MCATPVTLRSRYFISDLLGDGAQRPDRSLIAYAFLAQATRGESDLLSGLAPIFKPIARLHAGERFDCNEFSRIVEEIYGLKVHPWAVEDLAPRLEKAGLLVRVQHSSEVHEYTYAEITGNYDAISEADIRQVIHQFVEFAKPVLRQNNLPVDEVALEDGFLAQLLDMNFVSVLLKPDRSKEDNRKQSTLALKKPAEQTEWEQTIAARAKIDVLCAAFIVNSYHNDQNLYAMVRQIATGALVSQVILNLQDPGQTVSLQGLTVILDTPFLMSTLDLSSEEAHTFSLELCNQLREKGAQLAAFAHSVDELRDNLKAVIANVRIGTGFGATARRLSGAAFAAYASAVFESPEVRLKQDNVRIIEAPKSDDFFQYLTSEDQETLKASLGFFENQRAQERDAESIASTLRLRRGKRVKMGRFPTVGYLFITENHLISERGQVFLKRQNLFADGEIPPAVTERYIAGLLWVMFGGKGKDLPGHLLLANCTAALEPRSDVVIQMHRFLTQVDHNQADFFRTLMTEERAGQYMMQLTLGDSALLNQANAVAVLEQVKNSLIERLEVDRQVEMGRIKEGHETELGRHREISDQLRRELLDTRAVELRTREKLKETNERNERLEAASEAEKAAKAWNQKTLVERAILTAVTYSNAAYYTLAVIVSTVGGLITWFSMQESSSPIIKKGSVMVVWVMALLTFWKVPDLLFGNWISQFRQWVFRRKLTKLGVESAEQLFDIDWKKGSVVTRSLAADQPDPEQPQNH